MAANPPPPVDVWSANWKTVELFKACRNQWIVSINGPVDLDYSGVGVIANALGIPLTRSRLTGLQIMAGEALKHIRSK